MPFLENTAVHCSALCLLVISVERYVAISRPFLAARHCHPRCLVVPLIWTLSVVLCLPFAFMSTLEQVRGGQGDVM